MTDEYLDGLDVGRAFLWVEKSNNRAISFYSNRRWLDDGATLEDTRFNPPVAENRHSRTFPPAR